MNRRRPLPTCLHALLRTLPGLGTCALGDGPLLHTKFGLPALPFETPEINP